MLKRDAYTQLDSLSNEQLKEILSQFKELGTQVQIGRIGGQEFELEHHTMLLLHAGDPLSGQDGMVITGIERNRFAAGSKHSFLAILAANEWCC